MKKNLARIVLVAALMVFFILPAIDTDMGWHLRYGEHIVQKHSIIRQNITGFFMPEFNWIHAYSLYQLIVYLLFSNLGFWAITIAGSLIITACFLPLIFSQKVRLNLIVLSLPFLIFISQPVVGLGLRSQIISWLFFSVMLRMVYDKTITKTSRYFLIPLLFLFWANLHGGFIFGLIVLVIYALAQLLRQKYQEAKKTALITLLALAATFANPFGPKIYREIFRHSWYPLNQLIAEWTPPVKPHLLVMVAAITIVAFLFIKEKQKLKWLKANFFFITTWLIFTYLAFGAKRHLPFFGLSSIYLISRFKPLIKLPESLAQILAWSLAISLILIKIKNWPNITNDWSFICQKNQLAQPCAAVEYLKENPNKCSRIFNAYEWGGYLSWHLPEAKIFVDGRMPAWPTAENKSPYTIYLEIIQARDGWDQKLTDYQADCLFIGNGTFLDLEIEKNQNQYGWLAVYEDQQAVIYQRK